MRKILLVLLLALALPAPAAGKELSKLDVCGSSGCKSNTNLALLRHIGEGSDGSGSADAPALAPFYTLVYHVRAGRGESFNGRKEFTFRTYFVPSVGIVRTIDERGMVLWNATSPVFTTAIRTFAKGVEPFARPRIDRVSIGGKPVDKPASYERLITITSENTDYVNAYDWAPVKYHTTRPSPWNGLLLDFSAKEHALQRNNRWIHLDSSLSRQAQTGAPLSDTGGKGSPWEWVAIAAAGALATVGTAVVLIRRFRPWQTKPKTA